MAGLPVPVTTTDHLLAAVHDQLVGLRADLASSRDGETTSDSTSTSGAAELREPRPPSKPNRRTTSRGGS